MEFFPCGIDDDSKLVAPYAIHPPSEYTHCAFVDLPDGKSAAMITRIRSKIEPGKYEMAVIVTDTDKNKKIQKYGLQWISTCYKNGNPPKAGEA